MKHSKCVKFSGLVQLFKPLKSINEGIATAKAAAKFYLIRAEQSNLIPDVY